MLLALLCGTKSNILDFPGESTPVLMDQTAKLAKSSKTTVQRNTLNRHDPP
jgi:hypothetical protein